MRIVIPVSAADVHLLPDFTAAHVKNGGLEDHYVTFIPTPSVIQQAKDAAEKFEEVCPNVSVLPMTEEPVGGWPSASNNHFAHAARVAATQPERLPWLWMELDSVGLEGWANKLGNAYSNLGNNRSFLGQVQPHYRISKATNKPAQPPGDDRLSGVAIYPCDMAERSRFNTLLQDIGYGDRTEGLGFDEYLRHEIKSKGNVRAHTDLIDDRWNTVNYRVENDQLVCDSGPKDRSERERGGVVNSQAVLIHGCKDGSLHKLVAAGKAPRPSSVTLTKKAEPVVITATPTADKEDAVLKALAAISNQIKGIETRVVAIEKTPKATNVEGTANTNPPHTRVSMVTPPIEAEYKGSITAQKLTEFLNANGKGQTLKSAALHFDVAKSAVEELVNEEGSGFVVSGVAGWLKVADLASA